MWCYNFEASEYNLIIYRYIIHIITVVLLSFISKTWVNPVIFTPPPEKKSSPRAATVGSVLQTQPDHSILASFINWTFFFMRPLLSGSFPPAQECLWTFLPKTSTSIHVSCRATTGQRRTVRSFTSNLIAGSKNRDICRTDDFRRT